MTPETFFENFAHIAEAPNGVKKLRELILQMAVQGKLVPQDSSDEPAAKLLGRIRAEKARLVKEKKIRKSVPLPSVTTDEAPYALPLGWEWIRLGNIGEVCGGGTPSKNISEYWRGNIPWVSPKDMKANKIYKSELTISLKALNNSSVRLIPAGSILIVARSGILKRTLPVCINEMECTVNQDIKALIPHISGITTYLQILLKGFEEVILEKLVKGGMTVQSLLYSEFFEFPFPLPPLAEQERIVVKVDQLMTLCDELEAKQQRTRVKLTRLNNAALDLLTSARAADDFTAAWHLLRDNFDLLYTTPETIAKLRQSILQLAVQGKLVEQDPSDEPASVLLAKIKAEKERLVKEKKIRKSDPLPPVTADEAPYGLPKGWQWARFVDVANIASNLVQPETYLDFPHVAPDNIEKFTGKLLPYRSVRDDGVTSSNHLFSPGQIIYSKIRPNLSKVTIVDFGGLCSADMYPVDSYISPRYLLHYILSATFLNMAVKKDTRVAMPKINQEELNRIMVPVCPLAEQERIVVKVDHLLSLCDSLEARLSKAHAKAEKVAIAAVQGLLT